MMWNSSQLINNQNMHTLLNEHENLVRFKLGSISTCWMDYLKVMTSHRDSMLWIMMLKA